MLTVCRYNVPFNLFAFSFQLHIHAFLMIHMSKFPGVPSHPRNYIIVTIF
ncbi:hypothetical protein WOLCODRAFT_152870 [Wolfiporia cocos MD-104 SS10]|uniref:Uncharacterized protein n=1 Tax=Wolfiporia cocos (strain MD-104) TaxID=742152 RepID=A0A2H3JSD5_WOLCO|nr:hypothetical protein WOLCODRAFT_152870 [Wolfiporia cocos MD-104 SS10]